MNEIFLGKRKINSFSKPYIIAEIGVNHEGSINLAKKKNIQLALIDKTSFVSRFYSK